MAVNPDDEYAERKGLSDEERFRLLDEFEGYDLASRVRREIHEIDNLQDHGHAGPGSASVPDVPDVNGRLYITMPAWAFRLAIFLTGIVGVISGIVIGGSVW